MIVQNGMILLWILKRSAQIPYDIVYLGLTTNVLFMDRLIYNATRGTHSIARHVILRINHPSEINISG